MGAARRQVCRRIMTMVARQSYCRQHDFPARYEPWSWSQNLPFLLVIDRHGAVACHCSVMMNVYWLPSESVTKMAEDTAVGLQSAVTTSELGLPGEVV